LADFLGQIGALPTPATEVYEQLGLARMPDRPKLICRPHGQSVRWTAGGCN
jgi:hypothetical protein